MAQGADNGPVYAVGDVHGQLAMLEDALAWIDADGGAGAPVVLVGDLVDRGPDSRGVVELLARGVAEGRDWTVLLGNHDRLFRDFVLHGRLTDGILRAEYTWLSPEMGGIETLASYGIDAAGRDPVAVHTEALGAVPAAHLDFLAARPHGHLAAGMFFAHAGIRPGVPLDRQEENDLLWIRREFLDHPDPHPALIVHGHTPGPMPRHHGNRVNLDGGAGFGRLLMPVVFDGDGVFLLDGFGRARMLP